MNSVILKCILDCQLKESLAKSWDVLAADEVTLDLFSDEKNPVCLIVNTQKRTEPGKHWVAFLVLHGKSYFLDSFGQKPCFYNFNVNVDMYNTVKLQDESSNTCGYYTVHFVIALMRGVSMKSWIAQFSRNSKKNDELIVKLVERLLLCKKKNSCCSLYHIQHSRAKKE